MRDLVSLLFLSRMALHCAEQFGLLVNRVNRKLSTKVLEFLSWSFLVVALLDDRETMGAELLVRALIKPISGFLLDYLNLFGIRHPVIGIVIFIDGSFAMFLKLRFEGFISAMVEVWIYWTERRRVSGTLGSILFGRFARLTSERRMRAG